MAWYVVLRLGSMGVGKGAVGDWGTSGGAEVRVKCLTCLITGT